MRGTARIVRGNALALPVADATVDLIVTSPPYFGLRSYQDGGEHYDGQIGSEATPAEFVDALIAATAEMVRVLKPSGSIWVNLGDKYAPGKSLLGIPWRYALRTVDDLGLILRAEVIWSKPNGLPESVTDRVRRSHETWFHFTKEPRYFSAVDEVREAHVAPLRTPGANAMGGRNRSLPRTSTGAWDGPSPLGKLPGSVWTIPTQPLTVPPEMGVEHFAAFPMEWPRRIIRGWSPSGICTACGEGRRPVSVSEQHLTQKTYNGRAATMVGREDCRSGPPRVTLREITGYACACPDATAPTTPATVLDPFGGTGTTALVARALGCHGISVDMSADYCRLATWRTTDPGQLATAMQVEKPEPVMDGQLDLLGGDAA